MSDILDSDQRDLLDRVQEACADTWAHSPHRGTENGLLYMSLGLSSEAGEVAGKVKKLIRDHPSGIKAAYSDDAKRGLTAEVMDTVWYAVMLLDELDVNFGDAAEALLQKLADRKMRGVIGGSGDDR